MSQISFDLPWPDRGLSQNARIHWAPKAKLVRHHRFTASLWARKALGRQEITEAPVNISVTFQPPDRRRRDKSNCIGMFKSYEDGISDAIGIDDQHFQITYGMGEPVKGGNVAVVIEGA